MATYRDFPDSQSAVAIAAAERVTLTDLHKLAARLTVATGEQHSLFVSPRGVVVYSDTMGAMMQYPRA